MNYKISHPSKIVTCKVNLPASKSISNRLLIIQALCNNNFTINNLSDSDDTIALKKALHTDHNEINVGAAGTTFRFLTSFLAIQTGKEFILTGTKRIKERPIKTLVSTLQALGAKICYLEKEGFAPLKITGTKLLGGEVEIDGTISSQFITSILLIGPILKKGLKLKIKGNLVSKSYVKMTLNLLKEFGIKSIWNKNIIEIKPQKYIGKTKTVEADWSAASFWFEIAALSKKCNICLIGLYEKSIQGDKLSIEIFKELGVESIFDDGKLYLTKNKSNMRDKTYDLSETPDLYQPIACTLHANNIKAKFTGLDTLKNKETDRIYAVKNELDKLSKSSINTYNDHRMAMSFAPLCLIHDRITINNVEVVSKSYKNFWNDLSKAGFIIDPLPD
ncbi:MAG: 3-phosphoshikimate 1-carboxyvinyltransferase [Flavobacteriales bacterium]|nr:3-phosphoshikimate 1-carboxyvinyltransferase [Flavobacteriales bacterium]|tara:strand:+ start:654 stop:1823 length:1170 start_codon:yes stop_codon:yes gene_type:complete